jgi:ribonuclease R
MQKKRKSFEKSKRNPTEPWSRDRVDRRQSSRSENLLLSLLYSATKALPLSELETHLAREGEKSQGFQAAIDTLVREQLIIKNGKRQYTLNKKAPIYEGLVVQHPKGFGFISPVHQYGQDVQFARDPFVAASSMASAQHGDRVLIRILRVRQDDRPEAVVLDILRRGTDTIAGIFKKDGQGGRVFPDDPRYPFTIRISENIGNVPEEGDAVIVKFTRESRPTPVLSGEILEIIGSMDKIDTQMRLVIDKFDLPHQFGAEVETEAKCLPDDIDLEGQREDLRETIHVTIDGETAKDFDDAVCVMKKRQGFRLYVSIADVSHFVRPGSPIDREAYARGTSIYFPGRVIPMLPEKLSNNLCSLVPGKDRLTVSAVLDFDRSGTLTKKRFTRSVIRSHQRFTYTTVKKILIDKDPVLCKEHKPFLTQLKWAQELATALNIRRKGRGSIDLDVPEPEFTLTASGEVAAIRRAERNFAHRLIEEFMLAANEAVAELFSERLMPALYRVHEQPDPMKTDEFFTFAKTLGLRLPPTENSPAWFAGVLDLCRDSQYEYLINKLLLRSMKQAHYAAENVGHFGLASTDYTHFTSPIRRYPDLMVHRHLLGLLDKPAAEHQAKPPPASLKKAGDFLSARERTAIMAERDMQERLKISFMKDHVGDSFDAIISGVNDSALFLEIQDLCISGSIAVERLDDDHYLLDHKNHRLFGEITAKTYRIGDIVRVTLTDVDAYRKRLNFTLATAAAR